MPVHAVWHDAGRTLCFKLFRLSRCLEHHQRRLIRILATHPFSIIYRPPKNICEFAPHLAACVAFIIGSRLYAVGFFYCFFFASPLLHFCFTFWCKYVESVAFLRHFGKTKPRFSLIPCGLSSYSVVSCYMPVAGLEPVWKYGILSFQACLASVFASVSEFLLKPVVNHFVFTALFSINLVHVYSA